MRRYDNAPINNTCPKIDEIINKMEHAKSEAEYISKNPEEINDAETVSIINELMDAIYLMEDIRSDNSILRDWGNEENVRADDANAELDEAIGYSESLEDQVANLEAEVENLQEVGNKKQ